MDGRHVDPLTLSPGMWVKVNSEPEEEWVPEDNGPLISLSGCLGRFKKRFDWGLGDEEQLDPDSSDILFLLDDDRLVIFHAMPNEVLVYATPTEEETIRWLAATISR